MVLQPSFPNEKVPVSLGNVLEKAGIMTDVIKCQSLSACFKKLTVWKLFIKHFCCILIHNDFLGKKKPTCAIELHPELEVFLKSIVFTGRNG